MKKFVRILRRIIRDVCVILAALLMCLSTGMLILEKTLFNAEYLKQELSDKQIYSSVTNEVKTAAKNAYLTSDYHIEILDGGAYFRNKGQAVTG